MVGWRAYAGVSRSSQGELGKPIQIAHRRGVFSVLPERIRQQEFFFFFCLPVSRMKLCVTRRYHFNICIFDLDYRAGLSVSM